MITIDDKNIGGNYFNKHTSNNPAVKYLMRNFHKDLFLLIRKTKAKSMLDVGCGEGHTTKLILQRFPRLKIKGIDLDDKIVKIAKKNNPNNKFSRGTATKLTFKDNSFDLVILTEVLEHLKNPDKALQEAKRVTRGFVIVTVPNEPWWRIANMIRLKYIKKFGNTPGHIQHWSKSGLKKVVSKHFKKNKVINSILWNMAICKNDKSK